MLRNYMEAGGNKRSDDGGTMAHGIRYRMIEAIDRVKAILAVLRFIAARRKELLGNRFIAVYAARTFGHDLQFFDVVSRLYYPRRVSWLLLPGEYENPYLRRCFEHNIDFFVLKVAPRQAEFAATLAKAILSFYELCDTRWPRCFIVDPRHAVQTLSVDEGEYVFAPERTAADDDFIFLRSVPTSQYRHLINHDIGHAPRLPDELQRQCRAAIERLKPDFFSRPTATLVLRRKGYLGAGVNGRLRMVGKMENYVPAVRLLAERGFHVTATGDTDLDLFADIPGFVDLRAARLDEGLLNIFLLTNCALFLGQNSGPFPLVTSCGGQVVTLDAMPIAHAPMGERDLVLYKRVICNADERELTLADIFQDRPELAFSGVVSADGIRIEPNSADEIRRTVEEAIDVYYGKGALSPELAELMVKLKAAAPQGCLLKYYDARPPSFILRSMTDKFTMMPGAGHDPRALNWKAQSHSANGGSA